MRKRIVTPEEPQILGKFYPENPEKHVLNYHLAISFILRGDRGCFYLGTETKMPEHQTKEIMKHMRKALENFLADPIQEQYPVIITETKGCHERRKIPLLFPC